MFALSVHSYRLPSAENFLHLTTKTRLRHTIPPLHVPSSVNTDVSDDYDIDNSVKLFDFDDDEVRHLHACGVPAPASGKDAARVQVRVS